MRNREYGVGVIPAAPPAAQGYPHAPVTWACVTPRFPALACDLHANHKNGGGLGVLALSSRRVLAPAAHGHTRHDPARGCVARHGAGTRRRSAVR